MIDTLKFKSILENYKTYFLTGWKTEKYKWEAIKYFQKHWKIEAKNFGDMFKEATSKTKNLLASSRKYPREMIILFAEADGEKVRQMFRDLFDESLDLTVRINNFQSLSEEIRNKYNNGTWRKHYQNTNVISTYLWLMYPDKYYIYKYTVLYNVSKELSFEYKPKHNGSADNLIDGFKMYEELNKIIKEDTELVSMFRKVITNKCYNDIELKTLTNDVCFYLSEVFLEKQKDIEKKDIWFPKDYNPNITVEQWKEMLRDSSVFTPNSLKIMRRMKDYGGQATCTQLSIKYGESKNFYNSGSSSLARRVAEKSGCEIITRDNENSKWWPILYMGKNASESEKGSYIWRLRDELSEALDFVDLSEVPLYEDTEPSIWKISHGTESTTDISDENRKIFEERNVVVFNRETKAKDGFNVSQGQLFMESIKKGDYFYLCYGDKIQLLGQIISENPKENPEMRDDWYEHKYRIIARSNDTLSYYKNTKKCWTPNDDSMCIKIPKKEYSHFEELILMPYFNMTIDDLFNGTNESKRYWWLIANPKIWSFNGIKVGETQSYTLYNENGNKRRIFQNFLDVKVGDVVIGYEANPVKKIVAICEITQANDEKISFSKKEGLSVPIEYSELKECPELEKMEFFLQPNGSLFKLTNEEYDFIMDIIRAENPIRSVVDTSDKYTKLDFLSEVFMTEERYDILEALLRNKRNIILQGAPGVGKTFVAKKLAYAMMGEKDDSRIEFVQFHQNYSYEDFIMGYRPNGAEFKLTDGIFYRFCNIAANNLDKEYFFIIDEINRGNMSKIFGELMMLIEKEYRGTKATLAYNGMPFSVPENLYIIGMMNTADRSLAMIDYALRRRFSFFEMEPGFNSEGFQNYQKSVDNEIFNILIERINGLNREISEDCSLGRSFRIGHSYFCGREKSDCTTEWMRSVVEFDILPLLSEYWFDESVKLQRWENNLRGVFHDE